MAGRQRNVTDIIMPGTPSAGQLFQTDAGNKLIPVVITGAVDGWILKRDSGLWVAGAPPSGTIPDGADVDDTLIWDGAQWLPGPSASGLSAESATVETSESTSSTSYTDLATAGPAVTVTTGTEALVAVSCITYKPSGGGNTSFVSYAVSGATTIAAIDANGMFAASPAAGYGVPMARISKLTGLTAGSNTFTMKYKVDGSTFNFLFRSITVFVL